LENTASEAGPGYRRRQGLGRYPAVSLEKARQKARQALSDDNLITDKDFSGTQAFVHFIVAGSDTTISGNILGSLAPLPTGDLPIALLLVSSQYQLSPPPPMLRPVENCVIMKNDYRLVESGGSAIRSPFL
jgi:hypothetical protein